MITNFVLNIIGTEWFIIALAVLFLVFGTNQLPTLSKKIGRVAGEYNKTKQDMQNKMMGDITNHNIEVHGPIQNNRQKLEIIAKSLNINYVDKTNDELQKLITSKINETD